MARQHTAWILFLCICTLTEQFSHAARLRKSIIHQDAPSKDLFAEVTAVDTFEDKALQLRSQKKRSIGGVLMATAITAGFAGVGFEVYLAVEGCCGLYPEACTNTDQFKALKPTVLDKSNQVDAGYLAASNTLEYVKQCNYKNHEIWLEMKRIGELSETLIDKLDPELIVKFNEKDNEIKQAIKAKNATVTAMTYAEMSAEYQSLFKSTEGTMMVLSSLLGNTLLLAGNYAYKQYQVRQIEKTLTTDYGKQMTQANAKSKKFFGIDNTAVKSHLKETAVSQYKAKMATNKMSLYMTGANHVLAVAGIGFEIYGAIQKVNGCKKVLEGTITGLAELRKADKELDELLTNVTTYRTYVDQEGWDYIKNEITGDQVFQILEDISSMLDAAGQNAQTTDLKNAKKIIDDFIKDISAADYQTTFDLQTQLISSLANVTFVLSCQIEQVNLLNYVKSGCKQGHDSFHNLYTAGVAQYSKVNSASCHDTAGIPYTTEDDIRQAVEESATTEGFQIDCELNNENSKDYACNLHYQDNSDADIASKMGLTESQVNFFTSSCPPRDFLFPNEKETACSLKKEGFSDTKTASLMNIPSLEPQIAALVCPTDPPPTALPQDEQDKTCQLRGFGMTDANIASTMGYDLALVNKVVCPTTVLAALTSEEEKQVCQFRGFGLTDANISDTLGLDSGLVSAVTCS